MDPNRRLLSQSNNGRKDSISSLQEIWAELPESPKSESRPSSGTKASQPSSNLAGGWKASDASSIRSPRTPKNVDIEPLDLNMASIISDSTASSRSTTPSVGKNGGSRRSIGERTSNSFRMSTGGCPDALSPSALPQTRRRKGSDSSLLGAKKLIESALDQRSRTERRLSAQLERIEAQLRKSFGSSGGGSGRRRSTESTRTRRPMASPDELNSESIEFDGSDSEDNLSDGAETLFSSSEDLDDSGDNVQVLQQAHASLVNEHQGLQDEIARMHGQLAWIESQLQATKGHAQCLSRSTSDWAGMMRQIAHSTAVQEQLRVIQQGSMVMKHSAKKRGCGPRFLLFDMEVGQLLWSKTMAGAADLCRQINQRDRDTLERNANPFAVTMEASAQVQVGGSSNISCFALSEVTAILHGVEDMSLLLNHDASSVSSGNRLATNIEAVCRNREESIVAILTSDGNPLIFEFFNTDLAATFALGLRLCHESMLDHLAQRQMDEEEEGKTHYSAESKDDSGDSSIHRYRTPQKHSYHRHQQENSGSKSNSRQNTPRHSRHRSKANNSNSSTTGRQLPFKWPHGTVDTPESVSSFKSDGNRTVSSKCSSVRSLNASFELRSLEMNGTQRGRVSQLQKDLAATQSRKSYQDVLIGAANSRSQLVLPLKSNRESRNMLADQTQVLKDLSREKAILLNAATYDLGSMERTESFMQKLRGIVSDTIRQLAGEDVTLLDDSHIDFWTRELLLAASRTVIEGDVYSVCHRLLTGPAEALLCPSTTHVASPIEIFVAPDGLVTIESETAYRVVRVRGGDDQSSPEVWVQVHARCIEHIYLTSPLELAEDNDERNIRSLRLEFRA